MKNNNLIFITTIIYLLNIIGVVVLGQGVVQFSTNAAGCNTAKGCDFSDPYNWVGKVAPSVNDIASIDFSQVSGPNQMIQTINSKSPIQISGLIINADAQSSVFFTSFSNIQVKGDIHIGNFSTLHMGSMSFLSASGNVQVDDQGGLTSDIAASIWIGGTATFDYVSVLTLGKNNSLQVLNGGNFHGYVTMDLNSKLKLGGTSAITGGETFTLQGAAVIYNAVFGEYATFIVFGGLVANSLVLQDYALVQAFFDVTVKSLTVENEAAFEQNPNQYPSYTGPITVEIDSISGSNISEVNFGRADSVVVGTIYTDGNIIATDQVSSLSLGQLGNSYVNQLIFTTTTSNQQNPTGVFSANFTNIKVAAIGATTQDVNTVLSFTSATSWGMTSTLLENVNAIVESYAQLNLIESVIRLIGPNSTINVRNNADLVIQSSSVSVQGIIGAPYSSVAISASTYVGQVSMTSFGTLQLLNSTIQGSVSTNSTTVSFESHVNIVGSVNIVGQSATHIILTSLPSDANNVPIIVSYGITISSTVIVSLPEASTLKAGQVFYIASSQGDLSIIPSLCQLDNSLPTPLTYMFNIVSANNIGFIFIDNNKVGHIPYTVHLSSGVPHTIYTIVYLVDEMKDQLKIPIN
ncbi:hypothetical protein DFA_09571 [Cavenderia fasciculata]|uniref:Uncharacterized protein n=1 Tax=Cavenderia fasciculata TaxID=261658 RepID=F4Q802_CACFS|nr:uncharacterized protein DFA_09571 [Cavenderia fasciculata]EGG15902.1 hypothetical protein DFA_09571 [Cavenderia fasciculata]|eukprot:XP_004352227.1 hypothetical protein DFA_09571 [Cavenderia fasciculata]